MIQVMLLKSLLQVCLQYDCSNLLSLPSSFLEPLLCFTLMEDPEIRLLVLRILTSLLDRKHNQDQLETSVDFDVSILEQKREHSRHDQLFMRKNADSLYRHMFLAFKEESNGRDHFHSLFVLLAVVLLELSNEEAEVDLIRLVLALQELALSNQEELSVFNRCGIHAVCAAFMSLICGVAFTAELRTYVTKVVESRRTKASFLLPEFVFSDSKCVPERDLEVEPCCLFVQSEVCEALTGTSYSANIERLRLPYTSQLTDEERLSRRKSVNDVISVQLDLDPETRDPLQKPQEQITFETLKNAIEDVGGAEEEQRRRREVTLRFQTAPFEEIAALCGAKTLLQSGLPQVFELIIRTPPSPTAPRSEPGFHH
uniref:Uncharacterized protein n=1 Tax=Knipowitschia caucasica TaxID=637954 RepID=A0AAV2LCS0_KNICA